MRKQRPPACDQDAGPIPGVHKMQSETLTGTLTTLLTVIVTHFDRGMGDVTIRTYPHYDGHYDDTN